MLISPDACHSHMVPEDARTVCILRRMKRKSLGFWAWSVYNPAKAGPEELRFDLLDERGRVTGQISYDKLGIAFMKVGESALNTPWGAGTLRYEDGIHITVGGRELFAMRGSLLKKGLELVSPSGVKLTFYPLGGRRNDIDYSDESCHVAVYEEKGRLDTAPPGRPIPLTMNEIRALPKSDRPRSVETLEYVQYRIKIGGTPPVPVEDLTAALAMFASFGCLVQEMPK